MTKLFFCFSVIALLGFASGCKESPGKQEERKVVSQSKPNEWYEKYQLDKINLPPGYEITVYAEVPNARSMALSPSGILYVGNKNGKNVYAVIDKDKDGVADLVQTVATGLETPNGVAFKGNDLYIATVSTIYKLPNIEANFINPPKPVVVYDKYPKDKHHGWKFIAFGPDGKLYVPVGDPQNISDNPETIYSTLTRMNADGTDMEIYAKGIRNTVGFDWQPGDSSLWFTDNGRDQLGDNVPGDELNHAPVAGAHFGHPYCLQGNILDPVYGKGMDCKNYTPPVQLLDAHVAALGMRFYTGKMFDSSYTNTIFIAEHGSWNRSSPSGYRITTIKLDATGKSLGYSTFADGWLQPDGKVLGRPVDVLVMPDGALLVSDDYSGVIYRISKRS